MIIIATALFGAAEVVHEGAGPEPEGVEASAHGTAGEGLRTGEDLRLIIIATALCRAAAVVQEGAGPEGVGADVRVVCALLVLLGSALAVGVGADGNEVGGYGRA